MAVTIALVAGEASGDQLGARLIAALKARLPDARFLGIGGAQMREEGLVAWHDSERLAVNGFGDALRRLPELLAIRRDLLRRIVDADVDLFIGIDAPDFNLGVERRLKKRGIRTLHYVSPSIWAWRGGRARKIKRSADHVLCLFPCEPELYAKHGVAATFVGHPLADEFPLFPDKAGARAQLGLPAESAVVALMPGSRIGEVEALADHFVSCAKILAGRFPDIRFLAPVLSRETRDRLAQAIASAQLDANTRITIMIGHSHLAMIAADAVLLASGTAALEAALLKRPMVVAYRISRFSYWILKRLMYLPWVSLPNILAREALVPELLQDDCEPGKMAEALAHWLGDSTATGLLIDRFETLHKTLARDNARRAAEVVLAMLAGRP
ncbi:lipid-A-disaccharide synthase [Niveibacterium terrae]|uniref:lipid-A-disaccharide synthase n=1 Tax=Niveibacterium terrae TaxID=3373598 RepID=UPI003A9259B3